MVTNLNDPPVPVESEAPLRSSSKKVRKKRPSGSSSSSQNGPGSAFVSPTTTLVYNEYGELVDIEKVRRPQTSADLSITDTLRLIRKAYHHEVSFVMLVREGVWE